MKGNRKKTLFFAGLAAFALVASTGASVALVKEWNASSIIALASSEITFTVGTDTGEGSVTKEGVTVAMSTMSRTDNYRTNANTSMTVSSTVGNITSIVITCTGSGTANYSPSNFSAEGYTASGNTGTWAGSATEVVLNAAKQVRMTSIVVTVDGKPSDEPTTPADPTEPSNPTEPTDPTEPTNPTSGKTYTLDLAAFEALPEDTGAFELSVGGIGFAGNGKKRVESKAASALLLPAGEGYIYNTTSLGVIDKIEISYKADGSKASVQAVSFDEKAIGSYQSEALNGATLNASDTKNEVTPVGDYGFFNISISNKNLQATSIVIYAHDGDTDPTEPAEPSEPTDSTDPTDPTSPTEPSGPSDEASVSTLTFSAKCEGKGVADDGAKWAIESDGPEFDLDADRGIHYGSGSQAVSYVHLRTSDIKGSIEKVVVNAAGGSKTTATISVDVGGKAFGGEAQNLGSSAADYAFSGSASGEIVITLRQESAQRALFVKSVKVSYSSTGEEPSDPNDSSEPVAPSQNSVDALRFGQRFIGYIVCDGGVTAPKTSNWRNIGEAYAALSDAVKDEFILAEANEEGNAVEQSVARYDYIIRKYGTKSSDNPKGYEDFMGRFPDGAMAGIAYRYGRSDNGPNMAIAVSALFGAMLFGGVVTCLALRRRKKNR